MARPRVVIVGAGFGGLRAARVLRSAPVEVLLLDRRNYHLFQPLLYQVATAGLSPTDIAYPVRAIFRRQGNVRFRMTRVEGVAWERREVLTDHGPLRYDYLILGVGARTNFRGSDRIARHGFGLKDLDDAVRIRNHVLRRLEEAAIPGASAEPSGWLTFAIVGGGPTGVEMAGALSELVRVALRKDFRGLADRPVRIVLLEAAERILPAMPADLSRAAARSLTRKGVEVLVGRQVADYDGRALSLADGTCMPARTLIWTAGVDAAALTRELGARLGPQGRVAVRPTLQLPGRDEVYVIGDAAYLEHEGAPLPMMAPVAMQMGAAAAQNIRRSLRGEPLEAFRYRDPGSLATIGRHSAVAYVHGLKFRGFSAWAVWLVVHLIRLIGFRNRLVVLINWAWDYVLYERAVRLITPE